MSMQTKPKDRSAKYLGFAIACGIAVGAAIGVAVGDVGQWTAYGVPIGVGMYGVITLFNRSRQ